MAPKHCHTSAALGKRLQVEREGFSFELGTGRGGLATLAVAQVGNPHGAQCLLASTTRYLCPQSSINTLEEDWWGEGDSLPANQRGEEPASPLSVPVMTVSPLEPDSIRFHGFL